MSFLIENIIYLNHSLPSIFTKADKDEFNKKKKMKKKKKESTWTLPFFGKSKKKKKKGKDKSGDSDEEEKEDVEVKVSAGITATDYGPPYYTETNPDGIVDLCEICSKYPINVVQVHLLLNERVDPNLYDPGDSMLYTPMHWAARDYNIPVMKMLRLAKADLNKMSMLYQTPLVIACLVKQRPGTQRRTNQIKCIEFLLERHALVNTRDKAGLTCLDYVAMNDDVEIAKLLIEAGAKIRHKNEIFTVKQNSILELMKSAENCEVPGLRAESIEELKRENEDFEDQMIEFQLYNHMNYDEVSVASTSRQQPNQQNKTVPPNLNLDKTSQQDDIVSLRSEHTGKKHKSRCYKLINSQVDEQNKKIMEKKRIEDEIQAHQDALQRKAERDANRVKQKELNELVKRRNKTYILKNKSDHRKQSSVTNQLGDQYNDSVQLNTDLVLKLNLNKSDSGTEAETGTGTGTGTDQVKSNKTKNITVLDPRVYKPTADAVKVTELTGWSQCIDENTGTSQWKEVQTAKVRSTMLKTYSMNEKDPSASYQQSVVFDGGYTHTWSLAQKEMDILRARERGARDESVCDKWQEFTGKNIEFLPLKSKK